LERIGPTPGAIGEKVEDVNAMTERALLVVAWILLGVVVMGLVAPYTAPHAVVPLGLVMTTALWIVGVPIMAYQYRKRQ
jgi:hypothetical protein